MAYVYNPKPYVYKKKPIPGGRDNELVNFKLDNDMSAKAARLAKEFRKLGGKGGFVRAANEASLKYLMNKAAENLDKSVRRNRRPQNARTGALRKVIMERDSHIMTDHGFRFMDEDLVRAKIHYAYSLEYGDSSQIGRDIYFLFLGRSPNRKISSSRVGTQNERDRRDAGRAFGVRGDSSEKLRHAHRRNRLRGNDPFFGVQRHTNADGSLVKERVTDRLVGPREFNTGGRGGGVMKTKGKRFQVRIKNPVPEYAYGRKAGKTFLDEHFYEDELDRQFEQGKANLLRKEGVELKQGPKKTVAPKVSAKR